MLSRLAQNILLFVIHVYCHTLGDLLGGACRDHTKCSPRGVEAIREWGAWRGSWMTIKRIARCHPFAKGGIDPVPPRHLEGEVNMGMLYLVRHGRSEQH